MSPAASSFQAASWGHSYCPGDPVATLPLTACRMHSLSKKILVLPHSSLFNDLV